MRDLVDLGVTTPPEEPCAQVGSREYDYHDRARKEAKALTAELRRLFGEEPDHAMLATKSHPHDFGSYLTVVCYYDDQNPASSAYAIRCDSGMPLEWDEQARRELSLDPQ